MSLKQFHLLFIALAIVVTFFFGTWLFITVEAGEADARFVFGGLSYLVGIILILYARYILHKFRTLKTL